MQHIKVLVFTIIYIIVSRCPMIININHCSSALLHAQKPM